MEALQAGCYFINPIWDPPIGRSLNASRHSKDYIKGLIDIKGFFNDKPTLRQLDSQVPYLASSKFSGKGFTDSRQCSISREKVMLLARLLVIDYLIVLNLIVLSYIIDYNL